MGPFVFARFSPLRDKYSIEALYSQDLAAIEERLQQDGIRYSLYTGKVGENYIIVPVNQEDVDKDIWARNIVDDCTFLDLSPDLDMYSLQADAMGNMYDYAKREDRPHWMTFREYAATVVLYRALESCTHHWSERAPYTYLMDELDEKLSKHPRIAFRAIQQLQDLLQNY